MAFASLTDLESRLDWSLSDQEKVMATAALEDASELARVHGGVNWGDATAPRLVKTLVLRSCARYMRNPEGFVQSRAGDETVMWSDNDDGEGAPYFTPSEIKMLGDLGRPSTWGTLQTVAWGSGRIPSLKERGYVPVDYGGDPLHMFPGPNGEPW